jgi:hypothetical protein
MATGDEYYTDLLKVTLSYTGERNVAENIFYLSNDAAHGATLDQLQTLAEYIANSWGTHILPFIADNITFQTCYVADWTSADGLTGLYDNPTAGSYGSTYFSDQVASLVNYTTNLRYRGGRGRMYIPAPSPTALVSGDQWSSTFTGDLEAALATVFDGVNSQELGSQPVNWVLYHRGTTHVPQGVENVLVLTVSPTPGTQRRRVRRVGHKR